jgi:hypothetical protein
VGSHHHAHLRCAVRFPGILLAIAVVAVMGSGMANVIIAVAVFSIPALPGWCAATRWSLNTRPLSSRRAALGQRYDHSV